MKLKLLLCLALVLSGGWFDSAARADMAFGVDSYVGNAIVIAEVRAQKLGGVKSFPPPPGKQRVFVEAVLKGVDTAQVFLLPEGALKPNQEALVLFQYEPPPYELALSTKPCEQTNILIWPMDSAENVDSHGIPAQTESGFFVAGDMVGINMDLIKKDIASNTPEQVGLNRQVLDALLFPQKFKELERQDASRAVYVRFVVAILDLDHDVPSLARLLESQDKTVRAAALKRLEALTGSHISTPKDESSRSLHEWAQTWTKQQKESRQVRWPPAPSSLKEPSDNFPGGLLQSLQNDDTEAFTKAFASWLDSGVMRDRGIYYAETLNREMLRTFLPSAPRMRPDVLLNTNMPAEERMRDIALLAAYYHYNWFANERADAATLLGSKSADGEMLRRAAFWELRDVNTLTPGLVALHRLAGNDDEYQPISTSEMRIELNRLARSDEADTQRFLLGLCFEQHMDDGILQTIRIEIKAGRPTFINGLFDYLKDSRDNKARWISRLLCQERQQEVIPVMLAWLNYSDAQVRKAAAFNLCWFPTADAVSNLLDSIHSESNPEVKAQMLVALAQTGDKRGLETLLTAARGTNTPEFSAEIMRGLGRIRDPKALTTLADVVSGLAWITNENNQPQNSKVSSGSWYSLSDAANAFGYISHDYEAHAPDSFRSSSGINPVQLQLDIVRIEEWRKSQADKP